MHGLSAVERPHATEGAQPLAGAGGVRWGREWQNGGGTGHCGAALTVAGCDDELCQVIERYALDVGLCRAKHAGGQVHCSTSELQHFPRWFEGRARPIPGHRLPSDAPGGMPACALPTRLAPRLARAPDIKGPNCWPISSLPLSGRPRS